MCKCGDILADAPVAVLKLQNLLESRPTRKDETRRNDLQPVLDIRYWCKILGIKISISI